MLIYVDEGKFVIYNDDCLIGSYEHRVDPKTCEKIQINGDVVLQGIFCGIFSFINWFSINISVKNTYYLKIAKDKNDPNTPQTGTRITI